jgi:hypothetical protein
MGRVLISVFLCVVSAIFPVSVVHSGFKYNHRGGAEDAERRRKFQIRPLPKNAIKMHEHERAQDESTTSSLQGLRSPVGRPGRLLKPFDLVET